MHIRCLLLIGGMNRLTDVLNGCLDPRTVRESEQQLKELGQQPDFTEQLLRLIPGQQSHLLTMILSTLKNYLTERYNAQEGAVPLGQKQLLRRSIFDMYYELKHLPTAVELYKQIVNVVAMVDYPWPSIQEQLTEDLSNRIQAGVYVSRQIVKVYEYFQNNQRQPLQQFINIFFPMLENVVEQILSNFNEDTSRLLEVILKTFYCSFHISIPHYLRDFKNIERWMVFFSCIMSTPTSPLSTKNQTMIARIYVRLFSIYCNDAQDGKQCKGWAEQFRQNYAAKLHQHIYQLVCSRSGDQETLANLINCLHEVIKQEQLRPLMTDQQVQHLFYRDTLLPLCESSKDQLDLFSRDEIEYVRRQDDLTCYPVRRATLDLVTMAAATLAFNNKQEVMRLVEYCASVLSGQSREGEKEVAVRILMAIGKIILKHQYFKTQFQNLIVAYFQPLLNNPSKLLNALICQLLSLFLPFGQLSPNTVNSLMELIYGKIADQQSLVIRYNAILAFTALLNHKAALEAARPHFQVILEIYVKTLNIFDHQNLLSCLQTIVKHFDHQIVNFAPDLINHLLRMFCSLAKADQDEDQDQPDGNNPASATLSTVKQILDSQLNPQTYFNASNDLIDLLRGILNQYNNFFDEVLSLFAVLTYKAKQLADYQYPYVVCRRLLEGKAFDLSRSGLNPQLLAEIARVQKSDSQYQESLLAILKNIIQKGPNQILRNYSWPTHPQLILALIQNQSISAQELGSLDTSQVNQVWSPYLSSYSAIVYGVGALCNPREIKSIVGVSLFPWLKDGVNPQLVKMIIDSVDQENEDDDDLLEQNTAQLLQKYAQEDEDEDQQQFYQNSGDNYAFLYDSPFDSGKDREMMISQIKGLNQEVAVNLVNSLTAKYRKKLEVLMSTQ